MGLIVLVVDDETEVTDFLRLELEDRGFEVRTENSGYTALQHVMRNEVDILLTDIAMPDMDGFELYRRSLELDETLPIIMMTGFGYDPNHTVVKARQEGLQHILYKPFETDDLASLIERLTRGE
ncbi:MAG: response regulator [Candidatus Cloacimonetes bacterium]|nr:response regulator [Candidatus Cloacimonadota bacterium]